MTTTKDLLIKYFKSDCQVHTNDVSKCSRINAYDCARFYQKQFPWVEALVATNHSYPPSTYDSKINTGIISLNDYSMIPAPKIITGVEANILRNGELDIKDSILEKTEWILAGIHPLKKEYNEVSGYIDGNALEIQHRLLKLLENTEMDVIAHPTQAISEEILREINWEEIFETCSSKGVMIDLNLLTEHPIWWLQLLVKSTCIISIGSDFHGTYHCRRYSVKGETPEMSQLRNFVNSNGGRNGYDILSPSDREKYDSIYINNYIEDAFYDYIGLELKKAIDCGLDTKRIFNAYGFKFLSTYIKTKRVDRRDILKGLYV